MATSEHVAKPAQVILLDANVKKRAVQPKPRTRPRMPRNVREDPLARREWRRLVPLLDGMGVLRRADGPALTMLCLDLAILQRLQEDVRQTGVVIRTNGSVEASPLLEVVGQFRELVWRWFREFGLTPASRAQVAVDEPSTAKSKGGRKEPA